MKKQSAANNEFLADVKAKYNTIIYKKVLDAVNESGNDAGQSVLSAIFKPLNETHTFNLDEKVIYDGDVYTIDDYNSRWERYKLKNNRGQRVYDVEEHQLKPFLVIPMEEKRLDENDVMNLIGMVRNTAIDYPHHDEYYKDLENKLKNILKSLEK